MAGLFAFAAAVQLNDPDPIRWTALYLAAAGLSLAAAFGRTPRRWAAALGLAALGWGALIAADANLVLLRNIFDSWEMKDPGVEEARETLGLLIVAAWMAVLALAPARRSRG